MATAPGFGSRLAALPAKSKFNLGMGAAALVGIVVALLLWSNQGDYKVLYANLSDKDGGAIIAQIWRDGIRVKLLTDAQQRQIAKITGAPGDKFYGSAAACHIDALALAPEAA